MEAELYEEYARIQDAHWWFEGRRRVLEALLVHRFGNDAPGGRRILDIGCGTGTNLSVLEQFGQVVGVDTEAAAIAVCRERGWSAQQVEGSPLPFADGEFDLITLLDVIEHVPRDSEILADAMRLLRADGAVVVMVPAYQWMWGRQDEIAHHYRRYTRRSLLNSMISAGLVPGRSTYFNTFLFPPIAVIRVLRRLRPQPDGNHSDFEMTKPGRLNAILAAIFGFEARIVPRFRLPFGVSVVAIAEQP